MWIIDFEASGLNEASYPIEVGITNGNDHYSALIKPLSHWTHWNIHSEAIHHIPREQLEREGEEAAEVARQLNHLLAGQAVYCDCKYWDGFWAGVLFSDTFVPQQFEISDIQELLETESELDKYAAAKKHFEQLGEYTQHRALDDAKVILHAMKTTLGDNAF